MECEDYYGDDDEIYNNSSSDEQFKLPVKKRGRRPDWPEEMEENLVDIILSDEK